MKVPRLPKGKGFRGPGFRGCFNTGLEPAIFHSRMGYYVVGPELAARDILFKCRCAPFVQKRKHLVDGRREVRVFKTRGPALRRFLELCAEVEEHNRKEEATVQDLTAKAKQGDLSAAVALGDYE